MHNFAPVYNHTNDAPAWEEEFETALEARVPTSLPDSGSVAMLVQPYVADDGSRLRLYSGSGDGSQPYRAVRVELQHFVVSPAGEATPVRSVTLYELGRNAGSLAVSKMVAGEHMPVGEMEGRIAARRVAASRPVALTRPRLRRRGTGR